MYDLWHPGHGVEEHQLVGIVQEVLSVHDRHKAEHVEEHIEAGESPSQEQLVEHLLLGQHGSPAEEKQSGFKGEGEDEVPESGEAKVLHVFAK